MFFKRLLVVAAVLLIVACCQQKQTNVTKKGASEKSANAASQTLPGSLSMRPSAFKAEGKILDIYSVKDTVSDKEYYAADILINGINGMGSSLINIVNPGDTLHCIFSNYNKNDSPDRGKLLEAVIEE